MKGSIRASNFRELRGTLFWGPYNKDPTFQGTILGSPIFGNSHIAYNSCDDDYDDCVDHRYISASLNADYCHHMLIILKFDSKKYLK